MKLSKPANILLTVIGILTIFALGYLAAQLTAPQLKSNVAARANEVLGLTDFSGNLEVIEKLRQYYLFPEKIEKSALVEGSTRGLIESLGDKYTNYYSKEEWEEIQKSNSGEFQGIGVKLTTGGTYVAIETPLVGTPAAEAGIQALDLIMEVDGKDMSRQSIAQVANKIRGEEGSKVKLKIYRPSTEEQLEFEITRKKIDTDSIELKSLGNGIYQLTISKFTESDMQAFQQQLQNAVTVIKKEQNPKLVLDLRNNTGGWVIAAKYVLEEFLPRGQVILKEVDKDGNENTLSTSREGSLQNIPLVVLVNKGSASSSEIVAGALQDYNRAKVVGLSTTGKGVEQTIQNTSDGGVLFIVFKKWLTPNGRNLSESDSIKPDQQVDITSEDVKQGRDPQLDAAKSMLK